VNPNYKIINPNYRKKIPEFKQDFMLLLIEHYKKLALNSRKVSMNSQDTPNFLKRSENILRWTNEYVMSNDNMSLFLIEYANIEKIYSKYREWMHGKCIDDIMSKKEFVNRFEKRFSKLGHGKYNPNEFFIYFFINHK
jgi:hypothetical protein